MRLRCGVNDPKKTNPQALNPKQNLETQKQFQTTSLIPATPTLNVGMESEKEKRNNNGKSSKQ